MNHVVFSVFDPLTEKANCPVPETGLFVEVSTNRRRASFRACKPAVTAFNHLLVPRRISGANQKNESSRHNRLFSSRHICRFDLLLLKKKLTPQIIAPFGIWARVTGVFPAFSTGVTTDA